MRPRPPVAPSLGEVVARRPTPLAHATWSLSDAVDALVAARRTAAVVMADEEVQGDEERSTMSYKLYRLHIGYISYRIS